MIKFDSEAPMKRVLVIGPVTPFRGGISHHTACLTNALCKLANVKVESFARLYPKWLYPGRFQKDEMNGLEINAKCNFSLDSLNPLSWLTVISRAQEFKPDIVIIPWWTFFLAPCYWFIASRLRKSRIQVLFFCHNVVDHETSVWKRVLSRIALEQGDNYVVQTGDEKQKLESFLSNPSVLLHPHPVYNQFPRVEGMLPRRASTELLFYGFIRPYKGLDVLIEALKKLGDLSLHLTVVGEPWGEQAEVWSKRVEDAGLEDKVELVLRYVDDYKTAEYFTRADVVVLPYRSATGTGIVATAYHYRKPVIASNVGGLSDVVKHGMTGLLTQPGDPQELADSIRRFASSRIPGVEVNIDTAVTSMTWESLATKILEFSNSEKIGYS